MRVPHFSRFGRFSSGLFWRTFFLLGALTTVSMAAWVGMISVVQREPQVQQVSAQVISVVTITHDAHVADRAGRQVRITDGTLMETP